MIVYLSVIVIILFFRNNLQNSYSKKKEKRYCVIVYTVLAILAGMRYVLPGTDMAGYMEYYNTINSFSWGDIIENWNGNYIVYYYLCKLFSFSGLPYQFWFAFIEAIFLSGFARLINRLSSDKLMSIFLLFTIGLYTFSFNGMKQVLAMALVWHSFAFFYDKKLLWTVIFAVLAFFSHKTAAFFIMAYALFFLRNIKLFYIIIIALTSTVIAAPGVFMSFMAESVNDEQYLMYLGESSTTTFTVFAVYLLLFIAAVSSQKRSQNSSIDNNVITGLAFISVVVQLFSQVSGTAFRLALYYSPFMAIMIGNNVKNKSVRIAIVCFLTVFMLYTGRQFPYKFFWQ